jgi:hypothetical protein
MIVIGKGRSVEGSVQHADEQLGLVPAPVEAEDELVQIALEVLRADSVEGPAQPGLQVPEDRVRAKKKTPRNHTRSGTRVPWKIVPAVTEP